MSIKKFKSDVSIEALLKLPNLTANRVITLNGSGEVEESAVTNTELSYLTGTTSSVQSQLGAKADLVSGKVPVSQLPALVVTEVFVVADIAARDALTVGAGDGEVQEGDIAIVLSNVDAVREPFIYDGTQWQTLDTQNFDAQLATKTTDDLDEGTTNKYFSDELAQDAVGAMVVNTDTVNLTYTDATPELKADVKTQMSITSDASGIKLAGDEASPGNTQYYGTDGSGNKGYHAFPNLGSAGDISETSFSFADNQASPANVTGLAFAAATVRSFKAQVVVERGTTYETFELMGVQRNADFTMAIESVGDDTGVVFTITTAGQVQYTSSNTGDAGVVKFRALTLTV